MRSLLELLYPERCAACDALTGGPPGLCEPCAASLYPVGACCPICAEPATTDPAPVCRGCAAARPPWRRALAPWRYGGELATALRRLKYGGRGDAGRPELARPLGALLAPALAAHVAAAAPDAIVPVPLHPWRHRARGFSQAHALARAARRHGGVRAPLLDALARVRPTEEQAGLTRAARARNVEGAFAATCDLAGLVVLLFDDVITTGATAAAATRALLAAGARAVDVLALARAEPA